MTTTETDEPDTKTPHADKSQALLAALQRVVREFEPDASADDLWEGVAKFSVWFGWDYIVVHDREAYASELYDRILATIDRECGY